MPPAPYASYPPPAGPAAPSGAPVPPLPGTPTTDDGPPPGPVLGIIALVLAVLAVPLAFLGLFSWISWGFGLAAFVLGLIALFRKARGQGLAIAAVIVSVIAFIISIVSLVVAVIGLASDPDPIYTTDSAQPTEEATSDPTPDATATSEPTTAPTSAPVDGDLDYAQGEVWVYDAAWFEGDDATVWDGTVDQVIEVAQDEYSTDTGRCFVVLGTLTPTRLPAGETVSNWLDTPYVELLVDGRVQDTYGFCDVAAVEAAGYEWLLDAEVTVGTTFAFYEMITVPETLTSDPEAVLVGNGETSVTVDATLTDFSA